MEKNKGEFMDMKFEPPEINEEEGEILCDKCEGKGSTPSSQNARTMAAMCSKCQGRGKVDWISHITGVPEVIFYSSSSGTSSTAPLSLRRNLVNYLRKQLEKNKDINKDNKDDIVYAMAKRLATKIDEEISDSIIKEGNKHVNLYDPGGKVFDNGIISKLMFYADT